MMPEMGFPGNRLWDEVHVQDVSGEGHWNDNPLQYSCLENPHGQRNPVGYSPWGCKESDTAEQLSTHTH